jgi:hypothetical protein
MNRKEIEREVIKNIIAPLKQFISAPIEHFLMEGRGIDGELLSCDLINEFMIEFLHKFMEGEVYWVQIEFDTFFMKKFFRAFQG